MKKKKAAKSKAAKSKAGPAPAVKGEQGTRKHAGKLLKPLHVTAVEVTQASNVLYLFSAKASQLFAALSINRRIPDKDEGYQRVLSGGRVQAITRYLKQNRPLPAAIIINLSQDATFSKAKGELTIPAGSDVGWVIDGQHRLAGAELASREGTDIELPVVAFVGISDINQIEQFVTINRESKNVPTSLYLDLLHYLPNKKSGDIAKERAADIATELRKDEESPFFERVMVTSAPKGGQVSLVNFVRKISAHVAPSKGILNTYTEREQMRVISNYFEGLRQVFPKEYEAKESMFFKTIGFGALWNVFPVFFSLALQHQKGFTVKDVAVIFRRIDSFEFAALGQYGSGDQAERTAADDIKASLLLAFQTSGESAGSLKL